MGKIHNRYFLNKREGLKAHSFIKGLIPLIKPQLSDEILIVCQFFLVL